MAGRKHRNALPEGYVLREFRMGKVLGHGGFGITYLALDTHLDRAVAIKEYLPVELSTRESDLSLQPITDEHEELYRWGLGRFLSEAKTLARFEHPNIVRVHNVLEANNTAYMVMALERGQGMDVAIRAGKLKHEGAVMFIVDSILDGLERVHSEGFIHRDIKPANILIREDGSPVLLDFGSARVSVGTHARTMTSVVSPGFAPYEQYNPKGEKQGPWTDIYALGATLYAVVNKGRGPTDALARMQEKVEGRPDPYVSVTSLGAGRYSDVFLNAIDAALRFLPEERPQSVEEWRGHFSGFRSATTARLSDDEEVIGPAATHPAKATPGKPKLGNAPFLGMIVVLIGLIAGGWFYYQDRITPGQQDVESPKVDTEASSITLPNTEHANAQLQQDERLAQENELRRAAEAQQQAEEEALRLAQKQAAAEAERAAAEQAAREAESARVAEEQASQQAQAQRLAKIARLLELAETALQQDRLDAPPSNNAAAYYNAVLAQDPSNTVALEGLKRLAQRQRALAEAERRRREETTRIAAEEEAARLAAQQLAAQQQVIDGLLQGAQDDLQALRLTNPEGNNAAEKY